MKFFLFFAVGVFLRGCSPDVDPRFETVWDQAPAVAENQEEHEEIEEPSESPALDEEEEEESSVATVRGRSDPTSTTRIPRPDFLLLNEILYDILGSDADGQLFLELFGTAGSDVSGFTVHLINGDDGKIKESILLPDGARVGDDGLLVIADARTGMTDVTYVPRIDVIDNFDPSNGPNCIQLVDHQGSLLDALGYGAPLVAFAENGLACFEGVPTLDVAAEQSLSRIGGADTDHNEADFIALDQPTPGVL